MKLANMQHSKCCGRKSLWVRLPPAAQQSSILCSFLRININLKYTMEQENKNNKIKWIVAILLLFLAPPLGIFYIWKEMQCFYKKLHLLLWLFGGETLMFAVALSTIGLPELSRDLSSFGITIPSYVNPVLILIALLSILQIVVGFIVDKKVTSSQSLSKSYQTGAMLLMLINSTLLPIIFVLISSSITQSVYSQLGIF